MVEIYLPRIRGPLLLDFEDWPKVKERSWCANNEGYLHTKIVYKLVKLHHFIVGKPPKGFVTDHINRNILDNRRSNLRFITKSASNQNRNKLNGTSSKYYGVHWRPEVSKYRAEINVNKKRVRLGYFLSERDAAIAYNEAAVSYYGENAKLNII